jgi:glucuronosyltransferase
VLKGPNLYLNSIFSYKANAKKYSELAKDQQVTSLENAVWWTEYVIRHKGAKHLHAKDKHMPIYQFYMLDIGAFVGVVLLVGVWTIGRIVGFLTAQLKLQDKERKKSKIK